MIMKTMNHKNGSLKEYYSVANKEMDSAMESRKLFYDLVKRAQSDYCKLLDNSNLEPQIITEILNREVELVKMVNEKNVEIRNQEKEIEDRENKKDTEKETLTGNLQE